MLTARLLAAMWLLLIGAIWLVLAYIVLVTMSGISTPAYPVWLLLMMYFAGPVALIVGSVLVLARRYDYIGLAVVSLACAWLTWMVASDSWPRKPENDAIAPMQYDWIFFTLVFVAISSDIAVLLMWWTRQHLTKR